MCRSRGGIERRQGVFREELLVSDLVESVGRSMVGGRDNMPVESSDGPELKAARATARGCVAF